MKINSILTIVLFTLSFSSACFAEESKPPHVMLNELRSNSAAYHGKEVFVTATVTKKRRIPFSPIYIYSLYDNSESMKLVSVYNGSNEYNVNDKRIFRAKLFFVGGDDYAQSLIEFTKIISDILVKHEISEKEEAEKAAHKISVVIFKLLGGRKFILFLIENEPASTPEEESLLVFNAVRST